MPEEKTETHRPIVVGFVSSVAMLLLVGCGGGGSSSAASTPGHERQVVDLPEGLPGDTSATEPSQTENLLNNNKFRQVKASAAWGRGATGDGTVIGIMEEVNSFHPDLSGKIHQDSVLTSSYSANAPAPDERFVTDMASFMAAEKYPDRPCLLQYGLDCPDPSGDEKYFLRYDDGTLGLLPGLKDSQQRVTIGNNAPKAPEFGAEHGTGVASAAAADSSDNLVVEVGSQQHSLQGVAHDAEILVYARPLNIAGLAASFIDHADYLRDAPRAADVYNFSHTFGEAVNSINTDFGDDMRNGGFSLIAKAIRGMGKPFIAASGNERGRGEIFPRFPAALPLFFPYLRGQVLAVTAIGGDGVLTGYANPCGALPSDWNAETDGRHYCLAAPGGDSTDPFFVAGPTNSLYSLTGGTSFAAPMVAGAFAVLKDQFRDNMGDDQLLKRLMETASREGIYADADIYGAGLLDLDAATSPFGATSVSIAGDIDEGIFHDFDSTLLSTSTVFGDSLKQALQDHKIAAFDELGAPFWHPLASLVSTSASRATLQERHARLRKHVDEPVSLASGGRLSLISQRAGALEQMDMSLRQPIGILDNQAEFLFTAGDLSTAPLGLHADESFAHPYLHFAGEGIGFGGALDLGAGQLTAMGFASGGGASAFGDTPIEARGGLLEYALEPFTGVGLGLQTGAMMEESRALGLLPQGGFGEISTSSTAFAGASLDGVLDEDWNLRATMLLGRTNLEAPSSGLLASGANLSSSAFRLALEGSDVLLDADKLDIFAGQPLRIESGAVDLTLPVGRTPSGFIVREHIGGASLEPSGRELELGVRYEMSLFESVVATTGFGAVREGGHSKNQATEFYGLANLRWAL